MKRILLLLIIILAFFLRFYRLGDYPALNADEAAIGYNAYSLIQTGKDEHGNAWPIHFQSFNDYKPGLYFYLVLPLVKTMGLNEWAVRIPGALLGVLTVLVVYLLTRELFNKSDKIALSVSFFLAISPWHIHFSRGGWEVNTATFFITLGVWLFLKALNNPRFYILSGMSFVLSLYTYHAARIVVPLLGLCLLVIYRKNIKKYLRQLLFASLFSFVLLLPLAGDMLSPAGISRLSGVGLISDPGPLNRTNEQRGEHVNFTGVSSKVFHNKVVNYGLSFFENWGEHYWGEFLFINGDGIQRNKVPEMGQMYLFDILFVVAGLIFLLRDFNQSTKLIICWVAVAPVAAALTFQSPHALRSHNMVVPLTIISALGFVSLMGFLAKLIKNKGILLACRLLLIGVIVLNFSLYEHMYWVHMAKEYPFSSQYGVKELVDYIKEEGQDKQVVVADGYDQPYILFLFYLKYPPQKFQGDHVLTARDNYGFSTVRGFDKYSFVSITDWNEIETAYKDALVAGIPHETPPGANIIKRIFGSNGVQYFSVVAN